ncbi:MAG: hypothetical protein CMM81_12950 [Rhodospirillales bacterium]|mgnify:CR=1 FL=1|jgi:hypothetical protein|uniref:hypothetical protein n=1 Tax=Hwanghaeella sp. 1Z406 TaxID=3402811 RepID=UPI000C978302|nr:hypothetical protein [Rhodospirillales bacterium]|tara:strand:- start:73941 stop:74186 length:246 start_codon:yes stop_codon:yes gene_type:complete
MFFRKAVSQDRVAVGRSFFRRLNNRAVETAEVLGIASDGFGIPHVRYELTVEHTQSHAVYPAGTKVLSLATFNETYPQSVA